ncbi:MAG: transcription-repair coupling factor, partial [Betaproteobacteria bacterium]|nr:transcription-repair coupling factor [Betaproteobacteria bacterium]
MSWPDQALRLPAPGQALQGPTTWGSSDAFWLAQLAAMHRQRPALVLTAQPSDAERLVEEIAWFRPALRIRHFPDWETLPYDQFSPHQDLISDRLRALWQMQRGEIDLIVAPVSTAAIAIAPRSMIAGRSFVFKRGDRLGAGSFAAQLIEAGYEHVSQVIKPGEYCLRGGLIDLFPMGHPLPLRIDLIDDDIDSIKTFDPDTQRSLYPIESVDILPGREFTLDEEARNRFRARWRERFEGDPSRCSIYKDVGLGLSPGGIEWYLPLFFEHCHRLIDYLPDEALVVLHGDAEEALLRYRIDMQQRYDFLSKDQERPCLSPAELMLSNEAFFNACKSKGRLSLPRELQAVCPGLPLVAVDRKRQRPYAALESFVSASELPVLILAESPGRRETLLQALAEQNIRWDVEEAWPDRFDWQGAKIAVGPLQAGFVIEAMGAVITESELYAHLPRRGKGRRRESQHRIDTLIRDLSELRPGDPVVHVDHGIGRYQGLVHMDLGEGDNEFLHLTYQNDASLYVPVAQLHLIGRYSGASPEDAPLHQLGSGQWEKAKRKAAEQARDTAAELLNLYARRALREGHAFDFRVTDYEAFCEGFGFEETPDQLAAIHAVVQDMISGKPMDRLVCGDVGFGKTEVALRAAFIAVSDSKQVAILAPTTLLAEQHFQTFSDRFTHFPVRIAELSRFRSAKEIRQTIDALGKGQVDIVIGTHKLLSNDVKFSNLGLVIIDEEHRFGVRQKEALKNLRAEVDVLTLTATPIPRTLAMSMEGIRDFSVIATAPQRRLAIKTFVRKETEGIIREAILRELKRGGQIYFLHNEVETIENRAQKLRELVPEASIVVGHGQMGERELERVMRDFHAQRFHLLLCTTIIETGIDVPSANTIIIHRSDRFGLAQLHQLRGRVGRSHHQAYAYLLIPDETAITKDAQKRLDAIQMMEELGSGFYLAMHDLEIRGAGEVLGDSQSGNLIEVGFSLYSEMLNAAVRSLKAGREPDLGAPLAVVTEINLHAPALLPSHYCPDIQERLVLYKRLAACEHEDDVRELHEEIIDRFGKMPLPTQTLVQSHRLR